METKWIADYIEQHQLNGCRAQFSYLDYDDGSIQKLIHNGNGWIIALKSAPIIWAYYDSWCCGFCRMQLKMNMRKWFLGKLQWSVPVVVCQISNIFIDNEQ